MWSLKMLCYCEKLLQLYKEWTGYKQDWKYRLFSCELSKFPDQSNTTQLNDKQFVFTLI